MSKRASFILLSLAASSLAAALELESRPMTCASVTVKLEGTVVHATTLAEVHEIEPKIEHSWELLQYLLDHGLSVKVLAEQTKASKSAFYNWRTPGVPMSPQVIEHLVRHFNGVHAKVRERELAQNKLSRELLAIAREKFPMLEDLLVHRHDIVDVLTPMKGKWPKQFPTKAVHSWILQNQPMENDDLLKVVDFMAASDTNELEKLREEYLARRAMVGKAYDPALSLRGNMAKVGAAKLEQLNRLQKVPYAAIDVLDGIVRHSTDGGAAGSRLPIRKCEVLRYLMMDAQTMNAWLKEQVQMGDHQVLPLVILYATLNAGGVEDVAKLLKVDEERARQILLTRYL